MFAAAAATSTITGAATTHTRSSGSGGINITYVSVWLHLPSFCETCEIDMGFVWDSCGNYVEFMWNLCGPCVTCKVWPKFEFLEIICNR